MKGRKSSVSSAVGTSGGADTGGHDARALADGGPAQHIVFACDAGTGSSAMGADEGAGTSGDSILTKDRIVMDGGAQNAQQAIDEAGGLLVAAGAVTDEYVRSMHEREESVSTFMGNGLVIPHGTNQAKDSIHHSALSVVRYPEGLDWNGKPVTWVIGIAGRDNEHLAILPRVAKIFGNKEEGRSSATRRKVRRLDEAKTSEEVLDLLGKANA